MSLTLYKCKYVNTIIPGNGKSSISIDRPPHDHFGFENGLSAVDNATGLIKLVESTEKTYETSRYFRIPSIIQTNTGTFIASYDIRWNHNSDIGGTSENDLCIGISRSTDLGRTWENPVCTTVWLYSDGISALSGVSDPSLAYDEENDCLFLFSIGGRGLVGSLTSDKNAELTSANRQLLVMSYSTDDGKSWSEGESVLSSISNGHEKLVGSYAYLFPGCSRSITLHHLTGEYAEKNGSILFPIQMWVGNVGTKNDAVAGLLEVKPSYTIKDGNKKVSITGSILNGVIGHDASGSNKIGASECAVCEDKSGRLVMIVKSYYNNSFTDADYPNRSANTSYIKIFQSTDCGNSWSVVGDVTVAGNSNATACSTMRDTSGCKSSICYSDTTERFYISYLQSSNRICPIIRSSDDLVNWETFDSVALLPSGYSDIIASRNGEMIYYLGEMNLNGQFKFIEYVLAGKKYLTTYSNGWNELVTNSDQKNIIHGEYVEKRQVNNNANGISAVVFKPKAFTDKDEFTLSNFMIMTSTTVGHPSSRVQFLLVLLNQSKLNLHVSSVDPRKIKINYTCDEELVIDYGPVEDPCTIPISELSTECDTEYVNSKNEMLMTNENISNIKTFSAANGDDYILLDETVESASMSQKGVYVKYTMKLPVILNSQSEYKLVAKLVDNADPYSGGVALRLISNASEDYHVAKFTTYSPSMNLNYEESHNEYKRAILGFDFMIDAVTDRNYIRAKSISFETGNSAFSNTFMMLYTADDSSGSIVYKLVTLNGKEAVSELASADANSIVKYNFPVTIRLKAGVKYYATICSQTRRSPADYGAAGNYASMSFVESENSDNQIIDTHYGNGTNSVLVPDGIFGAGRLVPRIYIEENKSTINGGKIAILLSSRNKPAMLMSNRNVPAFIIH